MRITPRQLHKLIKEEVRRSLSEDRYDPMGEYRSGGSLASKFPEWDPDARPEDPGDNGPYIHGRCVECDAEWEGYKLDVPYSCPECSEGNDGDWIEESDVDYGDPHDDPWSE